MNWLWVPWTAMILLGLYETVALARSILHPKAQPTVETLSAIVRRHALERPIYPFLGGLLCGHFFWCWLK